MASCADFHLVGAGIGETQSKLRSDNQAVNIVKKIKNNIHGIVLLDKPTGMSSNHALQRVKHLFNAKKAGHTGSLDPLATGLLPICLGQATKICEYLLHSNKKYTTVIKLGETTDTLDSEGKILETRPVAVSDAQIAASLEQFRGDIKQVPPMYSALKKDGQPLYKLAREGIEIERPARDMTVHSLTAERLDDSHIRLEVHCSSGFYIRSLAHDIGQVLGCGAHVVELRRTAIKTVGVEQSISIEQLEAMADPHTIISSIDSLIDDMPITKISDTQAIRLIQGKSTPAQKAEVTPLSRFYTNDGRLFALGEVSSSGLLKTHKIFVLGQ
jgi:tRNA pseudouridine55 synthase